MTNFQKLSYHRNTIHQIAVSLSETKEQLLRHNDASLTAAANEVQDAYAALMEAAYSLRKALEHEKAHRS